VVDLNVDQAADIEELAKDVCTVISSAKKTMKLIGTY
jgi:hypothetical protein